jgi:two-component system, NarL family, sensor kinase
VADLVRTDPTRATSLACDLEHAIRETVGEIRRLVYDLRPPALDDLGLLAAIRERAAQFGTARPGGGGLTVRAELPDALPALPAAIEVAVYRIVQEGLMNVDRHAGARCCAIELRVRDRLHLEIVDDGSGLREGHRAGVGLRSMRERAEELGGRFVIESTEPAGTRLAVSFPLTAAEST